MGVDNNERAVFFGPEGDTSWSLARLREFNPRVSIISSIDIRDRAGVLQLFQRREAGLNRAYRCPAFARPRGGDSLRRFRYQCRRHAELAGSVPGRLVRNRRSSTCRRIRSMAICRTRSLLKELETRWDYADPAVLARHSGKLFHRPIEAFAVRRVESRRRRDGAGVRPLLSACRPAVCAVAA